LRLQGTESKGFRRGADREVLKMSRFKGGGEKKERLPGMPGSVGWGKRYKRRDIGPWWGGGGVCGSVSRGDEIDKVSSGGGGNEKKSERGSKRECEVTWRRMTSDCRRKIDTGEEKKEER